MTSSEQLLLEVEDLIRTMPEIGMLHSDEPLALEWFGRAAALVRAWDPSQGVAFDSYLTMFHSKMGRDSAGHLRTLKTILYRMRSDLLLHTRGPLSAAIGKGMVFDYFDELRKIIETARTDIFFVDPYLDADFVSRYLPHIASGTAIRLLAREKLPTLMPAVRQFIQQHSIKIEVRSAAGFHDRYVFIDQAMCYQSGASFKDGGKSSPTTLTQITDAFSAVYQTYEQLWSSATVVT